MKWSSYGYIFPHDRDRDVPARFAQIDFEFVIVPGSCRDRDRDRDRDTDRNSQIEGFVTQS